MTIKKRLILNFPGYEGLHPNAIRGRYLNSAADFGRLWHARTEATAITGEGPDLASFRIRSKGANWETETEFCQFGSADIFDLYTARSTPVRLFTGGRAFLNIVFTGTFWRYARTAWRFSLFFLWPFLLTVLLTLIFLGVSLLPLMFGLGPVHLVWSVPGAIAISALLLRWPGEKLFMSYLLDDWSAAYDRIHGTNPALVGKRKAFADYMLRKLRETDADEVVIVGHSLGTVPLVEAIADVWRRDPAVFERIPVSVLSVGSCLLMIGLHPKAGKLREDARIVFGETPVIWAEFQSLTDIIHFYKTDPVEVLRIEGAAKPVISAIKFRNVHSAKRYKRAKGNFFKMHLLFIKGAQMRQAYDIAMFHQGPFPFRHLVIDNRGKAAPLDNEGRLIR
ncbi:MAG: alpha/beta hydrolase [Phyllobacterium sp.]